MSASQVSGAEHWAEHWSRLAALTRELHKLCEVDLAVLVHVHLLDQIRQRRVVYTFAQRLESALELSLVDLPGTVLVELIEGPLERVGCSRRGALLHRRCPPSLA
jgi:hypothetical protein